MKKIWYLIVAALGMAFAAPGVLWAEEPTDTGNNLSVPTIWAEGVELIPEPAEVKFAPAAACLEVTGIGLDTNPFTDGPVPPCVYVGSNYYWLQQSADNRWVADTTIPTEAIFVDVIDWGDNLEVVPWFLNSVVRVETVLHKQAFPQLGYAMTHLWERGVGEMHGASGSEFGEPVMLSMPDSLVYSACARLTIQKLHCDADPAVCGLLNADVTWDPVEHQWQGAQAGEVLFNRAVFGAIPEGDSESYGAEVNIKGGVVYGYNWFVASMNDGEGMYRLTFSLDPSCPYGLNTFFDEETVIKEITEDDIEEVLQLYPEALVYLSAAKGGGTPIGGKAAIDYSGNNLTFLDLCIEPFKGSGGGGGGGNGGPGGGSGGGGSKGPK